MSSEINWVDQLKSGPPESDTALKKLRVILLRGLSHSLAMRGGGEAFAEDVVQETLIKVMNSLDSFAGRSRFTSWAITIATRTGISALRRRHFQNVSLEDVAGDGDMQFSAEAATADPSDRSSRHEVLQQLNQLVNEKLTTRQRKVMLAALAGMPMEEIARRMHSNRNAIYKLFHDARKKLRAGFESLGVQASDIQAVFNM